MVERENGDIPERGATVEDVSQTIKTMFSHTFRTKPDELAQWRGVLDDIIGMRQQQHNVRAARQRMEAEQTDESRERYAEESYFLGLKDTYVLGRVNNDDSYNNIYTRLTREVDVMDILFNRADVEDHMGATTRELKRIRRFVRKLDT